MILGFRHKGLEEIHRTGWSRRIGSQYIGRCTRILQLLEVAMTPEDMNISGYRFHGLLGKPPRWPVRVTGTIGSLSVGQARMQRRSILKTITKKELATKNALPPVHPGEIIREDIIPDAGLSITATAKALGVSRQMLHEILAERRPLSAVMCLKVARLFGSSPEMWMRLQAAYDLKKAVSNKKVMARVARIVPLKLEENATA